MSTPVSHSVWTFIEFEAADGDAERLIEAFERALRPSGGWYCDFRNEAETFVVFAERSFRYHAATATASAAGDRVRTVGRRARSAARLAGVTVSQPTVYRLTISASVSSCSEYRVTGLSSRCVAPVAPSAASCSATSAGVPNTPNASVPAELPYTSRNQRSTSARATSPRSCTERKTRFEMGNVAGSRPALPNAV